MGRAATRWVGQRWAGHRWAGHRWVGGHGVVSTLLGAVLLGTFGCQGPPAATPEQPLDPALQAFVLPSVPADVEERLHVDFQSKVALLGYETKAEGPLGPGELVSVKLYFRSVRRLGPGWKVFGKLLDARGKVLYDPQREQEAKAYSMLSKTLPPERWEPGKVYVDTILLRVPRFTVTPRVTVAVGLEHLRIQEPAKDDDPKPADDAGKARQKKAPPKVHVTHLSVTSGRRAGGDYVALFHRDTGITPEAAKGIIESFEKFEEARQKREAAKKKAKQPKGKGGPKGRPMGAGPGRPKLPPGHP